MSWSADALSHPPARHFALFSGEKKCAKNPHQPPYPQTGAMKKRMNSVLGEDLEDLREQESQRIDGLLHKTLLNSALGETFEDLHHPSNDPAELECQRSARGTRSSPVLGENLEHLQRDSQPADLGCQRSAEGSHEQPRQIPALPPTVPPFAAQGDACACNDDVKTRSWALR